MHSQHQILFSLPASLSLLFPRSIVSQNVVLVILSHILRLRQNKTIRNSSLQSGPFEALVACLSLHMPTTHSPLLAHFLVSLDPVPSAHHSSSPVIKWGVTFPLSCDPVLKSQMFSPSCVAQENRQRCDYSISGQKVGCHWPEVWGEIEDGRSRGSWWVSQVRDS